MSPGSRKSAYLISLKYSPGLKKYFGLIGENLRRRGIEVTYLLGSKYAGIEGDLAKTVNVVAADDLPGIFRETAAFLLMPGTRIDRLFATPPAFICFFNSHPLNLFIARRLNRRYPETLITLYLHEPFMLNKASFGTRRAALIHLIEFLQARLMRCAAAVIAPSDYAQKKIRVCFPRYRGAVHVTPLLTPDSFRPGPQRPRHFAMVGMANDATGHDDFFRFVNYAAARDSSYSFSVISSSNLTKYKNELRAEARGQVTIINKKIIRDGEINHIIRRSYAVFRFDRGLTQSAVLVDAFMNGSTVIARDIPGLRQHIRHKENGYLLPYDFDNEDVWEATEFVKAHYAELSANARRDFEEIWAEDNFDKYYRWLLDYFDRV